MCYKVVNAICEAKEAIKDIDWENADFEAKQIVAHALGIKGADVGAMMDKSVSPLLEKQIKAMVLRRKKREPLQYILGEWDFMGLNFNISPGVLIPRPETEILAKRAIELIQERGYNNALDLCCGTGCIGISIAKLTKARVTLADISKDCVARAKENAVKNGVDVEVVEGDLFKPLNDSYDIILCNPPYLSDNDMEELQEEVRFEPELALKGGKDGYDFYRRIAKEFKDYIKPQGAMLLEIGIGQGSALKALFGGGRLIKDLNGLYRVLEYDLLNGVSPC